MTSIWEGVYGSFGEVAGAADVFDDEFWVDKEVKRLERELAGLHSGVIPASAVSRDYILAPWVAAIMSLRGEVDVLDFGGGLASGYIQLKSCIPQYNGRYHIVETDAICREGVKRLKDWSNLSFHSTIPNIGVDIVHVASALHYVDDWRALLRQLVALKPGFVILSDLPAGDIPTFVTTQNFYGSRVPVWFWNVADIIGHMKSVGYKLTFHTHYATRIRGQEGALPMQALPGSHRLEHTCHLGFVSEGQADV